MTTDNKHTDGLMNIVNDLGKEAGYEQVDAEFCAFNDLKIRWTRSSKWIEFHFSDYLDCLPEDVFSGIISVTLAKIKGQDFDQSLMDRYREYLSSDEFRNEKRETFVRRHDYEVAYMDLGDRFEGVDVYLTDYKRTPLYSISMFFGIVAIHPQVFDMVEEDKNAILDYIDGAYRLARHDTDEVPELGADLKEDLHDLGLRLPPLHF